MTVARRQEGAALLLAMIIVALVATLATSMVWQQWRAVQVESMERARSQAGWMLEAMFDFGRLILREDGRTSAAVDSLTEPWAQPLEEARISTFLAADKENTDDAPEAFVSGAITDAQSRFNLTNLVAANGEIDTTRVTQLGTLCVSLDVAKSTAEQIAKILYQSRYLVSSPLTPLEPRAVEQLSWFGLSTDAMTRLAPYVVILPTGPVTTVNVNTAPATVIAAVLGIEASSATRLVQMRASAPFKTTAEVKKALSNDPDVTAIDVRSNYFLIRVRLRLDRRILEETSLVRRDSQARTVTALNRQRDSLRELTP